MVKLRQWPAPHPWRPSQPSVGIDHNSTKLRTHRKWTQSLISNVKRQLVNPCWHQHIQGRRPTTIDTVRVKRNAASPEAISPWKVKESYGHTQSNIMPSEIADAPAQASAQPVTKQPPPEKPSESRRRTYVILSFWFIVLVLGLPIWWKTTTIYRADLPLERMLHWADGKVRPHIL